jgi:CRISPR-associated protein Cmr6
MRIQHNCKNLSLLLRKGLDYRYQPTGSEEENKKAFESAKGPLWERILNQAERNPVPSGYKEYFDLMTQALGPGRDYTFTDRVVVGLGNVVPVERGISLHHLFGTPIFPGSGIKGILVREALYQLELEELVASVKNDLPFAWADLTANSEEQKKALWQMQALFGDINGAGRLKVYDALWVPEPKAFLRKNIDTQHNVRYYTKPTENHWPDDTDGPNPIQSVTLARDVKMRFWLDADGEEWTSAAYELLSLALERIGIGAKTSAGYGRVRASQTSAAASPSGGSATVGGGQEFTVQVVRPQGPTVHLQGRVVVAQNARPGLKKGDLIVVRVDGRNVYYVRDA